MSRLCTCGLGIVAVAAVFSGARSAQEVAAQEVAAQDVTANEGDETADAFAAQATTEYDDFMEAVRGGRIWLNFRYRYEYVDQDNVSRNANAHTLRSALGYQTAEFYGFSFMMELEDVATPGSDHYNSTTNGNVSYPVVADPDGTEVNQVYVDYSDLPESYIRVGRQEINLDNQRFVGAVAWRQNHQSFDAGTITNESFDNMLASYSYVTRTNRIFGDDNSGGNVDTNTSLLNVGYTLEGYGKATAYYYRIDNDHRLQTQSTSTIGARFAGKYELQDNFDLVYAAEYADQSDVEDNPNDVSQEYWLGELGGEFSGWTLLGAYEHLGGSGDTGDAFQTPLATLHKFNGWADQFLVTPDSGLEDYYGSLRGKIGDFTCQAAFHVFESDSGNIHYGNEFDAEVRYAITPDLTAGLRSAFFNADEGGYVDVTKVWFYLSFAAI